MQDYNNKRIIYKVIVYQVGDLPRDRHVCCTAVMFGTYLLFYLSDVFWLLTVDVEGNFCT